MLVSTTRIHGLNLRLEKYSAASHLGLARRFADGLNRSRVCGSIGDTLLPGGVFGLPSSGAGCAPGVGGGFRAYAHMVQWFAPPEFGRASTRRSGTGPSARPRPTRESENGDGSYLKIFRRTIS